MLVALLIGVPTLLAAGLLAWEIGHAPRMPQDYDVNPGAN
jgi:hypothetical protein